MRTHSHRRRLRNSSGRCRTPRERRDLIGVIRVKRETIDYIVGRALLRAAISAGYRPKRAAEHKGAARHRRWKRAARKAATRYYTEGTTRDASLANAYVRS